MKKIKNICLLSVGLVSVVVPTLLTTSCSKNYSEFFKEVDINKGTINNSKDLLNTNKSIKKLLSGDKSFHNGNYIILLGSECSSSSNTFFTYDRSRSNSYVHYSKENAMTDSYFLSAIDHAKDIKQNSSDFGITTYIDVESLETAKEQNVWDDDPTPFDAKWTQADDDKARKAEKVPGSDQKTKKIKTDHYIREDKSAKAMRELIDFIKILFTTEIFKLEGSNNMPFALTWKDGIPQKTGFKTVSTSEDVKGLIDDLFAK